jgi:MoaA/NifB/PqqE/SkfB family radical SAM enzyme
MLRDGRLFGRKTSSFTLQWHLTNACELACSHCYDRRQLGCLALDACRRILDDFFAFCRLRRVSPQVCLTGGNPFLHPNFDELYRAAAETGCAVSLLANPVPEERLATIVALRRPVYFQVSLEGRREHNDSIRGDGHFDRVLAFLPLLRKHGVRSHVMMTVHRDNLAELLPLARELD